MRSRQGVGSGRIVAALVAGGLIAAACSGGAGDPEASDSPETTTTVAPPEFDESDFPEADSDAATPAISPEAPFGSSGFSRYVYSQTPAGVVPVLVEGPQDQQVRCQDIDLPCSYNELKELEASGEPPPEELGLTPAELKEMVSQLDATSDYIGQFASIDDACAAGMVVASEQAPNMGIHMQNMASTWGTFDPTVPDQVLFAREGGEEVLWKDQGDCVDRAWTGADGYEPVGAVFLLPIEPDHPEGFAGDLDNWHVHYNICQSAETGQFFGDPEGCEADGGYFEERGTVWMLHAYVQPNFESQTGVFAMWNNSIWPRSDAQGLNDRFAAESGTASIDNFSFDPVEVGVGEEVVWSNSDGVPHTVTAYDGDFDSGVFGTGELFSQTFDEAGEYDIFCSLHPEMTSTIRVLE